MHDEALNSRSFSKRASPSKNSLPTIFGKGNPSAFCRNCQTNQMLILNLLSNYLPAQTDPSYQHRLDELPAYKESLHSRYPPVCEDCLPIVEEEIQKKNTMARSQALGGWLKETKGKDRQRRVSGPTVERHKVIKEMVAWRIRGILWALSLALSVISNSFGALGYASPQPLRILVPVSPFLVVLSLIWTAWDPTYSSFRKAQIQGRDVRLRGKKEYIVSGDLRWIMNASDPLISLKVLQMLAWSMRLVTSSLLAIQRRSPDLDYLHLSRPLSSRPRLYFGLSILMELLILIRSLTVLRIQTPPSIRLIDTDSHKLGFSRSTTPNPDPSSHGRSSTPAPSKITSASEPDLFASLSLSSKPVLKSHVFGLPSMGSPTNPSPQKEDDQMDWTPTDENSSQRGKQQLASGGDEPGFWLHPQRFFAPEQPTGLETLFEKTKLSDDVTMSDSTKAEGRRGKRALSVWEDHLFRWWWLYVGAGVAVLGVGLYSWIGKGHQTKMPLPVPLDDHQSDLLNAGVFRHIVHSESQHGSHEHVEQ
ncbi:hypothetical protein PQX77_008235 [Marasmius sp. AFHP31]|nr:hypothetical protein PQX77_008294 [Marasmius sp. AFHP31]KAK1228741.1 hypothetical protein PQX77_008235 [Marasmius sp. AFHP31]